ncbi:Methyl-accepting chemotaxis protein [Sulfidibacter corallicola]|uniref:Methyl-accepting chemotaxis protein n=1 Tax=Sulfidibacter corallicola TaxID=2818388 RepID=A0A8A4TFZ3_SULCO|nr:methyl-accepting chemotaxis protein [Sulfidibacter corallicola]QTD48447.1 methyl-accepting chemotaxis protein [Sulfidibacter corallicola]
MTENRRVNGGIVSNFNNNTKISKKIAYGFGFILILLLIVAAFSVFGLLSANRNFKTYRSYALQTNQMGRVQANLLTARLHAKDFILNNTDAASKKVSERIDTTGDMIAEAEKLFERQDAIDAMKEGSQVIATYASSFGEVTELVRERNQLVDEMNTLGPLAEKDLTKIMDSAFADKDPRASYLAGSDLRSLLLARLYANRFLVDNKPESAERAEAELAEFERIAQDMKAELQNPERRALANSVLTRASAYRGAFEKVVAVIQKRNHIIHQTLDVIGPNLANQMERMKLENKGLQDELGPRATQKVRNSLVITSIISLVSILVSLFLAIKIGRAISEPVVHMTDTMNELAAGNLEVRVPALDRTDEVGDMARAVEVFKKNAVEVEAKSQELAHMNETQRQQEARAKQEAQRAMLGLADDFDSQIGSLIDRLVNSSSTMIQSSESMKKVAKDNTESSMGVASASEESSTNVTNVALAMEEMVATSNEIASQTLMAQAKSRDTATYASDAHATFAKLNSRVQNIGDFVVAIRKIAEQTNLLALNATIEAARAGKAGTGFAVVAEEVKNLAAETALKTEDISSKVTEIQSASLASLEVMKSIGANIAEIEEAITGVSAAVEQQNATSEEINRSVVEASKGVQQVSQIISEVKDGAWETGVSADSVLEAADGVAELSDTLKTSVERFLDQIRLNYQHQSS